MSKESKCQYKDIKDYKSAFECFKQRFLVEKKSIFRLDYEDEILNEESIKYLVDNFIYNGYGGKVSFIQKIKHQLVTSPKEKIENNTVVGNAIEVLAHIVWLWRLVPANTIMSSTIKSVKEVLDLDNELRKINLKDNPFFSEKIKGIASTGTYYYNTNKPFEIAFVIKFLEKYLKEPRNKTEVKILNSINEAGVSISTTGNLDVKGEYSKIASQDNESRTASIFNALLFFFKPADYEPIVSNEHKKKIVNTFSDLVSDDCIPKFDPEIDWEIKCIKNKLNPLENEDTNLYFFYEDTVREQWDPSVLPAKNVIYYGAPGTGKTHDILKLVKSKVKAQCTDGECPNQYYEVVQFHPSYRYEDFMDGIKPVKSSSNINLELVDGVFKNMCKKAYKELAANKDNPENAKKFYFIADEVNRAELSRVFGELSLCIEEDKRLKFVEGKLDGVLIKTQNSNLWEEKNAVVKHTSGLCNEKSDLYFGVPDNIYFLATMNDIDKSIDSFDLALRRRFKWVHKGCDYDVIYNKLLEQEVNDDDIDTYISENTGRCHLLNEYINKTLNLGESYELGHSYFMNIKVHNKGISESAYKNLFDQEIAPLVSEYLRAEISSPKELKDQLTCMKNIFTTGEECK